MGARVPPLGAHLIFFYVCDKIRVETPPSRRGRPLNTPIHHPAGSVWIREVRPGCGSGKVGIIYFYNNMTLEVLSLRAGASPARVFEAIFMIEFTIILTGPLAEGRVHVLAKLFQKKGWDYKGPIRTGKDRRIVIVGRDHYEAIRPMVKDARITARTIMPQKYDRRQRLQLADPILKALIPAQEEFICRLE